MKTSQNITIYAILENKNSLMNPYFYKNFESDMDMWVFIDSHEKYDLESTHNSAKERKEYRNELGF